MPAPTSGYYDDAHARALKGTLPTNASSLRAMLLKGTYVFDPAHKFVADVVASECDFTNYARKTPANRVVAVVADVANLTFDAIAWASAGGAANNEVGWLVLFTLVTNDADSLLIAAIPLGAKPAGAGVTTDGSTATFTPNVAGVIQA